MNKILENTIGSVGGTAAGGVINAGLGMALGNYNNKQQVKQAGKLQELQIKGQKEMGEFNRLQQMKMFEDTGYGAQRKQMEDAGLNVGLMYGGSGSGGSTAANAGSVGGQAASANSGSEGMAMTAGGMAAAAQMELTRAMARKTNVEADKLEGADTDNTVASTGKLNSETALNQVKKEVEDVNKGLRKIELAHDRRTLEFRIKQQEFEVENQIEELRRLRRDNQIGDETLTEQVGLLKTNFANAILDGELKEMKLKVDAMTIQKVKADMSKMIRELEQRDRGLDQADRGLDQKDRGLGQEDEKIIIDRFKKQIDAGHPGLGNVVGKALNLLMIKPYGMSRESKEEWISPWKHGARDKE